MECLINSECYSNYEPLRLMAGIERGKTMADKLMNISNYDTQNYPFYRLQLLVIGYTLNLMNQQIKKSLKLSSQRIRKRYYETLGTIVINII